MTRSSLRFQRQAATMLAVLALALPAVPAVADEVPSPDSATTSASDSTTEGSDDTTPAPTSSDTPEATAPETPPPSEEPATPPTSDTAPAPSTAPAPAAAPDRLRGADLTGLGTWRRDSTGWWYRLNAGGYPASVWATINGSVYAFDSSGYMRTGWFQEEGSWFYLRPSGQRATGWVKDGSSWYYLQPSGIMATGWITADGTRYYLRPSGAMATGWVKTGGNWQYLGTSGAMVTGWLKNGGSWYYLQPSSGNMATGWQQVGSTWYYLRPSGVMATGWVKTGGNWQYLGTSGAMVTGWLKDGSSWYYLNAQGAMVTGQQVIDGKTEQFTSGGVWYGYHAPSGYLQPTDQITSLGWAANDLTWGMNGVKVRIVQQRLGIWSSGTLASVNSTFQTAVRNFQARAGLPRTGVVDKATWDAMGTGYSWWVDHYQATPVSLSATRSERIEAMIGYAWNQLGSSYTWGGAGYYSLGFDCSGLVLQSLYAGGMDPQPINVHKHQWPDYRTSQELYSYSGFQHVPFSQRQRGDLIFYTTNGVVTHVGIYLGNDQVIHTDWMGRPARVDHVTASYSWSTITSTVVRPFP